MRPYLAVIYDSLIESLRSKVLWALLFCWLLLLGAIAPFGFVQGTSFRISTSDVLNSGKITEVLRDAANDRSSPAQNQVYRSFSTKNKKKIEDNRTENQKGHLRSGDIANMLNQAMEERELYSASAWPEAARRLDLKDILDRDPSKLNSDELAHRNRRLIELAFPGLISRSRSGEQIWVGYAGMKLGDALPITRQQASQYVEMIFLAAIMKIGLGVVAMFVAIVVTSPAIPDMFQAGSLHLLLSKPISRALLFLSKVIGGCIFVTFNITLLLVGLYILMGLRLEIWNAGILWCIPLFLFIFLIFYSVSAFAGLIWKNAIVSIVVTAIFWAICFAIGLIDGVMQPFVKLNPQLVAVKPVEDQVFSVSNEGHVQIWDPKSNDWRFGYNENYGRMRVLGPLWLQEEKQLYFGRAWSEELGGGFNNDDMRLLAVNLPELGPAKTELIKSRDSSSSTQLSTAEIKESDTEFTSEGTSGPTNDDLHVSDPTEPEEQTTNNKPDTSSSTPIKDKSTDLWSDSRVDRVGDWPARTRRVIEYGESFVALTEIGMFQFNTTLATAAPPPGAIANAVANVMEKVFNPFNVARTAEKPQLFEQISPTDWLPEAPMDFAFSPDENVSIVYSRGRIFKLTRSEPPIRFKIEGEPVELPFKPETVALVAASNHSWLIAPAKQTPRLYSLESMSPIKSLDGIGDITPRGLAFDPTHQRFAILNDEGNVWIVSENGEQIDKPALTGQGAATAIAFDDDGKLWVTHHVRQADRWSLESKLSDESLRPAPRRIDWIYNWIVHPIYVVNPKPSAVGETISYCLQREKTFGFILDTADLDKAKHKIDPWQPIWSNSLFIALLLGASCWYLYQQDL